MFCMLLLHWFLALTSSTLSIAGRQNLRRLSVLRLPDVVHFLPIIQNPIAVLRHQPTTVHLNDTANPRKFSNFNLQISDNS